MADTDGLRYRLRRFQPAQQQAIVNEVIAWLNSEGAKWEKLAQHPIIASDGFARTIYVLRVDTCAGLARSLSYELTTKPKEDT